MRLFKFVHDGKSIIFETIEEVQSMIDNLDSEYEYGDYSYFVSKIDMTETEYNKLKEFDGF